ncbi:metal ABC transporter permease [Methanosarcina mazei]|jgi:zinc transport system permease protein|uniref:Membrane protein n=6 Tax=Methanosarcina mazei TaxID=2209 RepID=A0A0F8JKI9_METMZ|nr:metal ABC transporter permease [Methanosarcina mazei]AAM31031.1 Zinc ABC transporter, permease protein [Methanosarcina mazei Go1]AKB63176.1 Zinc ABC transporter, inner membrane permease protein ZnuB [Methanosarcina mazei SarPi]AKB66523.1 Zinc ABC transporter, inner membrane permease protein ZnuB [Methanosarcina mazei S-6]AKB69869.1 Zinc ABC transporter, inner membrane permease protein ZnuB [Methanosarcina mazei LYC]AKB73240.1 Zinc ABC transporter, inner membrane permease protein ZnuB [Metha
MFDLLQYTFIQNALIAAVLASVACGIIGSYVVVKKIVFISGGIAHASFGGVGLGYYLGINPMYGVLPFSLLSALVMGTVSKKSKIPEDSAIGILWSLGMALGVIFVYLTPGYAPDLMTYLFGNILTVPRLDLYLMLALDIIIVGAVYLFYKEFLALCFDEEFTTVQGVPTDKLYLFLLCIIALTIVVLIKVVGIILVIALLTIPATISRKFTHNLKKMMLISTAFGAVISVAGIGLSYILDVPSGATIILVLSFVYGFVAVGTEMFKDKNAFKS